jgi:hypothetical protein
MVRYSFLKKNFADRGSVSKMVRMYNMSKTSIVHYIIKLCKGLFIACREGPGGAPINKREGPPGKKSFSLARWEHIHGSYFLAFPFGELTKVKNCITY